MNKTMMPSDMETTEVGTTEICKMVHHNTEVVDKGDIITDNPTERQSGL
jgi:hypothetical protein